MPAPFELPGHYWDEARGKFFKIEKTGTAPAGALWSQTAVSYRRKHASDGDAGSNKRAKRGESSQSSQNGESSKGSRGRGLAMASAIVRAPLRGRLSQLLARELGVYSHRPCFQSDGQAVLSSSLPSTSAAASQSAALANSLCYRGKATVMSPEYHDKVTCLYVHDEERASGQDGPSPPGLGMMYTNYRHQTGVTDIRAHFLPRDDNDWIPRHWPVEGPWAPFYSYGQTPPEFFDVPQVSAMAYHAPSRRFIVTSSRLTSGFPPLSSFMTGPGSRHTAGVCAHIFLPGGDEEDSAAAVSDPWAAVQPPSWGLRERARRGVVQIFGRSSRDAVYACAAAPAAAANDALCVLGSGHGLSLVRLSQLARVPMLPPGVAGAAGPRPSCFFLDAFATSRPPAMAHTNKNKNKDAPADVLVTAVDFFEGHPHLILAGTRQPHAWLVDLREPQHQQWHALGAGRLRTDRTRGKTASASNAVAHVRSVGGHRVVSACLRDTMVLYDVRRASASTSANASASTSTASSTLFAFDGYSNEARLFGHDFDVDPRLGLVAAGNDAKRSADGTRNQPGGLSLFSLATGERLTTGPTRTTRLFSSRYTTAVRPTRSPGAAWTTASHDDDGDGVLQHVNCLQFARLPGDQMPSLFVGSGSAVQKFSLGHAQTPEDDGFVDEPGYALGPDPDVMQD